MMKKTVFFALLIAVVFTGCIDIVEEINVNKDQSGHLSYRIETNDLGGILNSISGLIDIQIENQLTAKASEYAEKLRGKKGIENVNYSLNKKTGIYELSFDFATSRDLNDALYEVAGYRKNLFSPQYIRITNHKVKRINFAPWLRKYLKHENIDIPSKDVLDLVQFKSIVKVPEVAKNVKNKNSKLAENGLEIVQKNSLTDILNNKVNVGNTIKY